MRVGYDGSSGMVLYNLFIANWEKENLVNEAIAHADLAPLVSSANEEVNKWCNENHFCICTYRGFWRAKLFALVLVLVDYTDYFFIVWADITNILFSCLCGTRSLPNNCLKIIFKKRRPKICHSFQMTKLHLVSRVVLLLLWRKKEKLKIHKLRILTLQEK